jgi:hypothetical protein
MLGGELVSGSAVMKLVKAIHFTRFAEAWMVQLRPGSWRLLARQLK